MFQLEKRRALSPSVKSIKATCSPQRSAARAEPHALWELRMGSGSLRGSCTHGCWLRAVSGGGPVGTGTFRAPQEDTGELAAVQRALEKAHWKKD